MGPDGRTDRRALVVEDEALIAMDTQDALRDLGFGKVEVAGTFEEARGALSADEYDLVVFDLNLDGVTSLPLVEARRAAGRASVVTSGYDAGGTAATAGVPVLSKPVQPGELTRALRTLGL